MAGLRAYVDAALCKGCLLCVPACPTKSIIPLKAVNKKGYPTVEVDQKSCIGCGVCYRICPDYVFEIDGRDFAG